jgi:hypothetical protein
MFIKHFIKSHILKAKIMKVLFKYLRLNIFGFFINKLNFFPSKKKEIIIFSSIGGHTYYSRFDRFLERCFNLMGYKVTVVLCDKDLPICQEFTYEISVSNKINQSFKNLYCKACYKHGLKTFKNSNIVYLSDYSQPEYEKIFNDFKEFINNNHYSQFTVGKILLGEHVRAGIIRYYGGYKNIEKDDYFIENLFKFAKASIKTYLSTINIIKKKDIHFSILHHGIYVPQGVIADVLKNNKKNFYTYSMSYRSQTFFFAKQDTYHKKFLEIKNWDNFHFKEKHYQTLTKYFKGKKINNQDWIDFTTSNDENLYKNIDKKVNYFGKNNTFIMYTNVTWDAQVHFKNNVFENIFEWIDHTIEYFKNNKKKLLIVRSHPAEKLGNVKSRDSVSDYIEKKLNINLSNLIVIKPLDKINSYKLMDLSDKFLIYSSKIAIELLFYDKKILVAGEAFIKGKGFTLDVTNKVNYFNNLDGLDLFNLSKEMRQKSYKFIYFFFFRLMVKTNLLKKKNLLSNYPFIFDEFELHQLKKDRDFHSALKKMSNLETNITC